MLKKLTILLSCFAFIISSSSLASFADYFYGAFYNGTGYELKQVDGNGNSGAAFVMRFKKKPYGSKRLNEIFLLNRMRGYNTSINNRFKKYGPFNYKKKMWPFILHGTYKNLPTVKGYDRHHIVSNAAIKESISKKASVKAPAIVLRKDLHRKTHSYGGSKSAKAYRMKEYQYMKEKGIKSAVRKELEELDSISKISIAGTSVMETGSYSCLNGDSFISGINEPSTILGSHKLGTNMPIEEDWETYGFNEPSTILEQHKPD